MCLGIPGQITAILDPERMLAVASVGGVKQRVNIACLVDEHHSVQDCLGAWVLIHVGFALNRLDAQEAAETLAWISALEVQP
ncbi:MAG: hypothetical protein OHK0012_20920 [Synechococcales cyanobacterium]